MEHLESNLDNCVIIILGATGDLAKRKLIPAVFSFFKKNNIKNLFLVCAALDDLDISEVLNNAKEFIVGYDEVTWDKFNNNAYYKKLDFNNLQDFSDLNLFISDLEKKSNIFGNRLIYIASMSEFFCVITKNCAESGLIKKIENNSDFWHRIIYEKPFGRDLESAIRVNNCISKYFNEDQIFRVDHYLTKEIVENIAIIRFANCVFEPVWNNKYIDQIDVILDEKLCLEGRGNYYDNYGAVRDVLQNHILELIALTAMESPEQLTGDFIRNERVKILKNIKVVDGFFGQYEGYNQEKGVELSSSTETYSEIEFKINNSRWSGVKFYTRTGKCLGEKKTEIKIKFKKCDCVLLKGCPMAQNTLTINIYPTGSFYLELNVKRPGQENEIESVKMEFCHSCKFKDILTESYEVILREVINNERSISVRFDEIEYLWKIVDDIYSRNFKLYKYKKGSCGPSFS
ncbi:MAG: Glucose-6-phosphate 1-dehydrogenase [candidate division TM6 bacterium GW2011_GWF2_30_66]|nr:MAG: Glucose-6-phosphate 1-dehydrogenase [candidate division TM6 bacterium GW2011_GWF2_30_66]